MNITEPFAAIFPGQGSQSPRMLSDLADDFPLIQTTFGEASAVLGYDLWALIQENPSGRLDETQYTQPAILTASVALWRIANQQQVLKPSFVAGHSLGEYTALVCADALDFSDGVAIVAQRGRYMQEATPVGVGALAVIVGLTDTAVITLCQEAQDKDITPLRKLAMPCQFVGDTARRTAVYNAVHEDSSTVSTPKLTGRVEFPKRSIVVAANFNSPGQVVISGHAAAVSRALARAKSAGAKLAKLLPISVPAHSPLMEPAQIRLADALAQLPLRRPQFAVVNNVDVSVEYDPERIRQALVRQLVAPVQWVQTMQYIHQQGIRQFIEYGPGSVLTGLGKRIDPRLEWAHCSTQNLLI